MDEKGIEYIGVLIVCYITGSRPSSIALLPLTGVAFALDSELGIQRSYVKTAPDACDFDVPGRRTVTWPVTTTWQTLGKMLTRYDRMRRRVCSRATYFFNLGAAAPPNGHYAPKSFRSGFASAVTAMNVSPDRRNYIAGWAANSHAVGTHYVDNSVVVDDAARFLFGHLIGLPPPLWRCCRACRALELAAGQFGVTIGDTRLSSSWRYVTMMAILAPPKIFSSTCLIGVFD
ncbi:hypothetical protein RI054_02g10790 [Pseudoscourfieldia marina]